MEPEGPLPHSQAPATCACPEQEQSSPYPSSRFTNIHFNIILPSTLSSLLLTGSPAKTIHAILLAVIRATCPPHLILGDFITQMIRIWRGTGATDHKTPHNVFFSTPVSPYPS